MKLIGYAAALAVAAAPAFGAQSAQSYPDRPVRLIVPFTPGGAVDLVARRIAPKMSENWGQQVVVDNRPGGGGILGYSIVAKAKPDGYTLLAASLSYAMAAALYSKLPFDPVKDLTGVSQIVATTQLLVVPPSLGVKTVKELIALAKHKPGQLNYGSNGIGAAMHLNAEQFRFAAGIDVVHVPYKGVPEALIDLMTGRTHFALSPLLPALPFIPNGKLLAVAVSTPHRTAALPDVPTIAEALPGYAFQSWIGLFAPAGTPRPIVEQISREVARFVALPDVKQHMANQGEEGRSSTPEAFSKFVRAEIESTKEIVKRLGIRAE